MAAPTAARGPRRRRRRATRPPLFRQGNGSIDTNDNHATSSRAHRIPVEPQPIVEIGPFVLLTDPRINGINAPRDATIQVTFTEPVDVVDPWFDITCAATGNHNDATTAGSGRDHYITPNVNFLAGRAVHGHDLQGPGSRSGSGRHRSEHRYAARELSLVVHGRDWHGAALPAERPSDDGQPERRDAISAIRTTT